LIIIDVQEGLFSPEPNPADADAVIARINQLADRARSHGASVIFAQHERPGTAVEFGSAGWRLDRRLQVREHDIMIRKTTPDKPHMSTSMIRAHHNATLLDITSFGPQITALPAACLWPTP
jgi:nicotinamidase-related amidase